MDFIWKDEYSVGVKEIDDQHRHFVDLLSKLYFAISSRQVKQTLAELSQDLIAYADNHFQTEEKYFKEFNYEGAEEHIAEHRKLKEQLTDFQEGFTANKLELSFKLIDFLEDWLVGHLANMDKKYVQCFHEHGLR
jgi:hemerythrin